jgi:hypothetical protein
MSLLLIGCKRNDVDLTFGETPEERIAEGISELKTTLTGAENGWIGVIGTSAGGGFGLYVKFNNDETLEMLMDGNSGELSDYGTAEELKKSTFRVKHVMGISLLFDTYNYLTLLQDPVPTVAGGSAGKGLQSDVDFELVRYSENRDTIHLKGKKYDNPLVLYKASASERAAYVGEKYQEAIESTDEFFNPIGANYFEYNGKSVQVILNNSTKYTDLVSLDKAADTLIFKNGRFGYTISGADFVSPIKFDNNEFVRIKKVENDYYIYDIKGNKYLLKYSNEQIISLKYAIGVSIKELVIPGPYSYAARLPLAGWSSSFITHWNSYTNLAKNSGYNLTIGNFFYTFDIVNKRIDVSGSIYQNTSAFAATYQYTYEFNADGEIKFKSVGNANGNAGIVIPYMNSTFHTRMLNDTFIMGYEIDPYWGKVLKFTSKENPSYSFSWLIN